MQFLYPVAVQHSVENAFFLGAVYYFVIFDTILRSICVCVG